MSDKIIELTNHEIQKRLNELKELEDNYRAHEDHLIKIGVSLVNHKKALADLNLKVDNWATEFKDEGCSGCNYELCLQENKLGHENREVLRSILTQIQFKVFTHEEVDGVEFVEEMLSSLGEQYQKEQAAGMNRVMIRSARNMTDSTTKDPLFTVCEACSKYKDCQITGTAPCDEFKPIWFIERFYVPKEDKL